MLIVASVNKVDDSHKARPQPQIYEDQMEDQIRIKINKNKQILDHLAKFTKDIHSSLKNNKGMTLLYYDFNDSKSSLSSRTFQHKEVSSQLD